MDTTVIGYLNNSIGFSEASLVTTYSVIINGAQVTVLVNDFGPNAGDNRYMVEAFSPDIPEDERIINTVGHSLGNPDGDLKVALINVHWNVFTASA